MTPAAEEAAYLDALHALWRRNWPEGAPREPVYPLGEIPSPNICASVLAGRPARRR